MIACLETDLITRVAVIDHTHRPDVAGLVYSKWDVKVEVSIQDDGRTLKIFIKDKDEPYSA